jgi:REP element-mobilizing transposase RayT
VHARQIRHDKLLFVLRDRHVDWATDGPLHLKEAAAAQLVVESILFGVPARYDLYAFVVMANHVHLLILPHELPSKILKGIKGYTAYRINQLQGKPGRVFWQDESYDHWSRDEEETHRILAYIEDNPVAAGLCSKPDEWLWSSAAMRADWPRGKPWVKKPG